MYNPFKTFKNIRFEENETGYITRYLSFETDEVIISVDEPDDRVYFILSGAVKITNYSLKGKEIWHGTLEAGRTFGEVAALTGKSRSATIIALERTRLAVISRAELYALMRHDVEFAIWLLEDVASRLATSTETTQKLLSQSLSQRIRAEIYRLAVQQDETDEAGDLIIQPVPNLTELAKRLNTDRETVSREVSALSRRGVLSKSRDVMVLHDRAFFEQDAV